jgi:DNA replication and repair protein RecF
VWVSELDVVQWRNHPHSTVHLEKGVTLFIGPNGQGKTNIVEALYYLSSLSSHRVSSSASLIKDDCDDATVVARLHHGPRSVTVGMTLKRKGSSEAVINQTKAKASDIPQWVSTVMFSPEDSAIVRGEPGVRRSFMDQLVTSASSVLVGVYQDFERVLKQRNSLLKSMRAVGNKTDQSTLEVWDAKFVELAARIMVERHTYLDAVMPMVTQHYAHLAQGDEVGFTYVPSSRQHMEGLAEGDLHAVADQLRADVESKRQEELDRGMTLLGPQRDDLELTISRKPARTHASQGETWSLALGLRLGTAQWLRHEKTSGDPVIILDDVFAELDSSRRSKLLSLVSDYEQLLVTSAVEEDLPKGLTGVIYDVAQGQVTRR